MVLSEIEQQQAYREAREIMKLGQKWQQLMPGEKRPNFERAAKEVLRRALGHQVQKNVEALDVREGKLGTVLHSFVHGDVHKAAAATSGRHARSPRL